MTYAAKEISVFDAYPVELLTFTRGTGSWRYTSADEDKLITGFNYLAVQIKSGKLVNSQEMSKNNLSIKCEKNLGFLLAYRGSPPSTQTTVTLQRYHEGDGEIITPWTGRIVNVTFSEKEATIKCEPTYTSMKRQALRRKYQTSCPHVLYGKFCAVLEASFRTDATLTAVVGRTVTAAIFATLANDYFSGGFITWNNGQFLERRFITGHTGDTLTLNLPIAGLVSGQTVAAYAGCDHTLTTCNTKFLNEVNYGGQPFYPDKNPMGGDPVF